MYNLNEYSKSYRQKKEYKTSITGKISNANQENGENAEQGNTKTKKNLEIVASLKHLSNFWRTLGMPLMNCEVSLTLTWSENCVLTDITTQTARAAQGDNPAINAPTNARPAIHAQTNATFQIKDTKLYVQVVTLSIENDKRLSEQLRTGFKKTIKWNEHRSEKTNQTKSNNLNYLIDPTFTEVDRLFVLAFENVKSFFNMPIKNGEETHEQVIKMGKNND